MKRLAFRGWISCYQIKSGKSIMIASTDIGPRNLHLSSGNDGNLLKLFEEQIGKTSGVEWQLYRGHRALFAPEDIVMSDTA